MAVASVVGKHDVVRGDRPAGRDAAELLSDARVNRAEEFALRIEREKFLLGAANKERLPQFGFMTVK